MLTRGAWLVVQYNEEFPAKKMELVLFDDALKHLLRINRLIEMPRGSALLVGVGGSGKQSLTRLTAYICRAVLFQVRRWTRVEGRERCLQRTSCPSLPTDRILALL